MSKLKDCIQVLKQYGFKDEHGHPLEKCQEFVELEMALKCDQIKNASLSFQDKEGVKAAVLQSAIQNPHQNFSNLAYELCIALEQVECIDNPKTGKCGTTSTEKCDSTAPMVN